MRGDAKATIDSLRARIEAIERRPVLAERGPVLTAPGAAGAIPAIPGVLHEIFSDDIRNGGSALGFALGQARGLLKDRRPALIIMQLARETQEIGLPYGAGLAFFGIDPEVVVLTRAETVIEFLWAIEEAVSCSAVAAVVADIAGHHKAFDFTASRRLTMRSQATGTSVFLIRYGRGREASAAKFRWKVMPTPSGAPPFDARAPGLPRFAVTLEKGRMAGFSAEQDLLFDWTANGFALVDSNGQREGIAARRAAALSRSLHAALGDGLSQAS
jgi:protein ImuA